MNLPPRMLRRTQLFLAGVAIVTLVSQVVPPVAYTKDLQQEYLAARALRDGVDVFTPVSALSTRYLPFPTTNFPHPNPHPPVLDLISVPLSFLPFPVVVALWLALNLALLFVIGRSLGLRVHATLALAAWPPAWWVLLNGNIELLILVFLLLGWRAAAKGRDGQAGLWLGLATAVKLYPALLLLPFLPQRRFRVVLSAGLIALIGQIGNLLVVGPVGLIRYYRDVLPTVSALWIRKGLNSSPYGALLRLFGGSADVAPLVNAASLVLPLTLVLSLIGLMALLLCKPEAAPVAALVAMPNAWGYYAVLTLPQIVTLFRRAETRRPAIVAAAGASFTLPILNVMLRIILRATHWSGAGAPPVAGVLAAIQPAGYLGLLVLTIVVTIVERRGAVVLTSATVPVAEVSVS